MSSSASRGDAVNGPIRVVIVDDNVNIRVLLRTMIDLEDDMVFVGEAVDGFQAAELAQSCRADVIVMDVVMAGMDGIDATRTVKAAAPGTRVVVYSSRPRYESEDAALAAGADAYVEKSASPQHLVELIRQVIAR